MTSCCCRRKATHFEGERGGGPRAHERGEPARAETNDGRPGGGASGRGVRSRGGDSPRRGACAARAGGASGCLWTRAEDARPLNCFCSGRGGAVYSVQPRTPERGTAYVREGERPPCCGRSQVPGNPSRAWLRPRHVPAPDGNARRETPALREDSANRPRRGRGSARRLSSEAGGGMARRRVRPYWPSPDSGGGRGAGRRLPRPRGLAGSPGGGARHQGAGPGRPARQVANRRTREAPPREAQGRR